MATNRSSIKTAVVTCLLAGALIAMGCAASQPSQVGSGSQRSYAEVISKAGSVPLVPGSAVSRPGINDAYDGDDATAHGQEQGDDLEVERYGQRSSAAETRRAQTFVRAYYEAALHGDGAVACTLLAPELARSLEGEVYQHANSPAYMRGKTCAEIMTKLFAHLHGLLVREAAGVEVTAVRNTPGTVFVLLSYRGNREPRLMGLEDRGAGLRLEALRDSPYP